MTIAVLDDAIDHLRLVMVGLASEYYTPTIPEIGDEIGIHYATASELRTALQDLKDKINIQTKVDR